VAQTETVTPVKVEPSSAPATETVQEPVAETVNDTSNNKSADEILAMIRNRKNTEEAEA